MKLFYTPGTCSLAAHLVMRELNLEFTLVRVDNQTKRTEHDQSYLQINPKGYVAALMLNDGQVITESPAILQYLGDLAPAQGLVPPAGTMARTRMHEWLNFITAELHAGCVPLFKAEIGRDVKRLFEDRLLSRLTFVDEHLENRPYLLGERFSVADAYLFTVLTWLPRFGIDIHEWRALSQFMQEMLARACVTQAVAAEGIALPAQPGGRDVHSAYS
ncbi:glutathione S-transferase [Salinisphaera sp. C84B14]|uniref:glutathione transferase GstA n=1 Tax=Salinisphaera sp. C84B14 TaxID=1304155 RepID=UPI00333FDD20